MKKKLVSFLCMLMLGMSTSCWAFAPTYSNSELYNNKWMNALNGSVDLFVMFYARNASTTPTLRLEFILNKSNGTFTYEGGIVGPKPGTYYMYNGTQLSSNAGKILGFATNDYYTRYISADGSLTVQLKGPEGSVVYVEEGIGGPYIHGQLYNGNYLTIVDFICGTPKPSTAGTIQVVAGENGQVKVDNGAWGTSFTDSYSAGTNITISAQAADGYYFSKWDDDNSQNPRTISVNGDKTYTAIFERNKVIEHAFYWENIGESSASNDPEWGSGDGLYVHRFYITSGGVDYPSLELQLIYDKSKVQNYGTMTAPREGEYTMFNNLSATLTEFKALGGTGNTDYMSCYHDAYGSYKPFRSGTITISQGAGGKPYIVISTAQGNDTHQFFELTVGAPIQAYNLNWNANGGELSGSYTAAGSVNEGASITAPTATKNGYTFVKWRDVTNGVDFTGTMPSSNVTYTAQWNRIEYTITYNGLNDATNSNPTSYNIETETITLQDPGTRDGYIFADWKDESDNTITQIAKGSTGDRILTATWNVKSSNIELCENCDNAHYNTFKANYNNETVNVTYNRQFKASKWSTMCLPFSIELHELIAQKMYGRVYEFKYATGNANTNSGVNLYFSNAKKIEAGKCYIVNANDSLAEKTSFVFSGVTIDLTKDNGADLSSPETPEASMAAYNALLGYKSEGTIELVGTLRNGTLHGTTTGNTYMGLKDNKIYYPNISQGSTIWAYRGIFRSSSELNIEKMRIIVDGEDRGELIIDADGDVRAPSDATSRKFIRDGVLYIEREGVIYDAQGKRIE